MNSSVIIAGDLCAIGRAERLLSEGVSPLDSILQSEWMHAALRIANLESPLTDCSIPSLKSGPNLKSSPDCFRGLRAMHIDILGMANNHILDYGERGLEETITGAKNVAIRTVGAALNVDEATRFLIVEVEGLRIAFAAFAEHECSIAGKQSGGANPWSAIGFYRLIAGYTGQYDRLVVLFHGGKEYYEYPPPAMQERCRFMVELGADAVICQHSHCVGSYEVYRDSLIVYGQGNFIFDLDARDKKSWQTGMLVKLDLAERPIAFSFIPYKQFDAASQVCAISEDEKTSFLKELDVRSRKLLDPEFVKQEWVRFCEKQGPVYLSAILGQGKFMRRINRIVPFNRFLYTPQARRTMSNVIRCESLRETILTYLENRKV